LKIKLELLLLILIIPVLFGIILGCAFLVKVN